MAVLWQQNVNGRLHEVRSAGHSRRLYTDGVFHSQYNPHHPAGGHIWDLLMLPAFFADPAMVRRVLLLGVGGGAVMRQLDYFLTPDEITGIDINPVHLQLARRYFDINGDPYRLVEADAQNWVNSYQGSGFDMIVDDLYGEQNGEPLRAVMPDSSWFRSMGRLMKPDGILVVNFMSWLDLKQSAWYQDSRIQNKFSSAFRLSMPQYDNVIGVFSPARLDDKQMRRRLMSIPELDPRRKSNRLNYRLRKLV